MSIAVEVKKVSPSGEVEEFAFFHRKTQVGDKMFGLIRSFEEKDRALARDIRVIGPSWPAERNPWGKP